MDWNTYFLDIADKVASKSSCCRRQVGALIVTKSKQLISTGYNGTPSGYLNCNKGGCPRCNSSVPSGVGLGDCLCCHAEENAIAQAAKHGTATDGCILFTTTSPCIHCSKLIVNSGIREVVFREFYSMEAIEFLTRCKIEVYDYIGDTWYL